MYLENASLKSYAKTNGVYMYEVADFLKVSESTLSRELRKPLASDRKKQIKATIDAIALQKG